MKKTDKLEKCWKHYERGNVRIDFEPPSLGTGMVRGVVSYKGETLFRTRYIGYTRREVIESALERVREYRAKVGKKAQSHEQ